MTQEEKPSPSDYEAKRLTEQIELIALEDWFTDVADQAILDSPHDFTSSSKANAYGRQTAKKADPKKFARLRELELKWRRF